MKKVVVITGGSTGIGKQLALIYVRNDYHVIIISRNEDLKFSDNCIRIVIAKYLRINLVNVVFVKDSAVRVS